MKAYLRGNWKFIAGAMFFQFILSMLGYHVGFSWQWWAITGGALVMGSCAVQECSEKKERGL